MNEQRRHADDMKITSVLIRDHEAMRRLFERVEESDTPERKREVLRELERVFLAHEVAEERVLYPAIEGGMAGLLSEASAQVHQEARDALEDLWLMSPIDVSYDARVTELVARLRLHLATEEQQVFPEVRRRLEPRRLRELGIDLETHYDRWTTDDETDWNW
jgi:hemerythrin superfamily protein